MEIILAMLIATYVVKNGAVDLAYAVRGQPSPRQLAATKRADALRTLAEARAVRQGQPRPRRPGAFSSYLGQLWEDGWTDARSKHSVRRDQRQARQSRPQGAFRTYAAGVAQDGWRRWDAAWERADQKRRARPRRYAPGPNEITVPGTVVPAENDTKEPPADFQNDEEATGDEKVIVGGTGMGKSRLMDRQPSGPPAEPDMPEPADELWHWARQSATGLDNPHGDHLTDTEVSNRIIKHYGSWLNYRKDLAPIHSDTTPKGTTMTTTAPTEITGLTSAIDSCNRTATDAESLVTWLEQTSAGLTAGGVGGGTTGHLATAQEHFSAAAAAMRSAETELKQHLGVKEAYDATPDAGEKQFVTAE